MALQASRDAVGQWILLPHAEAGSETGWAGVIAGQMHTVRVDRVFRAGSAPGSDGEDCWWIMDYKTARVAGADPHKALAELRPLFAPQLEAYVRILRNLRGPDEPIRAGLYYPHVPALDWWEV